MISCAYVAAVTLQQKFKYAGKAYVLGSPSLAAELSQVGVTAVGVGVSNQFILHCVNFDWTFLLANYYNFKMSLSTHWPSLIVFLLI